VTKKSLDAEATQFDLKRQIFKLAMNYDFNEILINKLKALQDNPVSTFSDTTTIVADAANDVVNSIKNRLYDYEVFQDDDESKKAFENIFNQNLDVLGHSIDQFIKSYQQKAKEEKDAEQALIQERNEHIALQLTNIFLNNKGRNII
jgi:lipopolysaccharide biosynthesis regulator YciM